MKNTIQGEAVLDSEDKSKTSAEQPDLKVVEGQNTSADAPKAGETCAAEKPPELTLEGQIKAKEGELLRAQADFQNYRQRVGREKDDLRKYATTAFAQDLLPVLDAFEQCLKAESSAEQESSDSEASEAKPADKAAIKDAQGLALISGQFKAALQKHGIKQVGKAGEPFDPQWHQAIRKEESGDVEQDTIVEVYAPGFKIHDRVLRPAMVAVAVPK